MLIKSSLIFPQWDMVSVGYGLRGNIAYSFQVTIILCVFLLSYVYGEGKVTDT